MSDTSTLTDRVVQCSRCGHIESWIVHTSLRVAVNCPKCGAKKEFGPGVYVDDYTGKTWREAAEYRAKNEAAAKVAQ